MNLFETTDRSWRLLKAAIFVIRKYPRLVLFPILIGFFTLGIASFFVIPIIVMAIHHPPKANAGPFEAMGNYPHWIVPYALLVYPLSMFAATFCNVAFYSQIMAALNGDEVSIRRGLKLAMGRIKSIFAWSLFGGIVGALIQELESKLGFIGRIFMGLIGLTWSVACVFVIPIIIREEATGNPLSILRKSAGTIKGTWGEMFTGYIGLGMANIIFFSSSLVVLAAGIAVAIAFSSLWIGLVAGLIWIVAFMAYNAIANLASKTYLCALYIYASEGVIPEPYDQSLLDMAWKVKKS